MYIHIHTHCPAQSNTKIMIRGKGATKEGKFGRFGLPQPGEDEALHALITGQTPEAVKVAVDKVQSRVAMSAVLTHQIQTNAFLCGGNQIGHDTCALCVADGFSLSPPDQGHHPERY